MADEVRLIDANSVCGKLQQLIAEYERRIPDYFSNDVLGNGKKAAKKWGNRADGIEKAISVINEAPTVEAEPVKHGKWENDKLDIPRCSCCSYIPEFNRHIDDYYYSDFCPNCGARMGGGSE